VTAGYHHTVALDRDGAIYTWGKDGSGQLGDGDDDGELQSTPQSIGNLTDSF
jgi:alpha-tubulin suppressor-like RCC1 family protein